MTLVHVGKNDQYPCPEDRQTANKNQFFSNSVQK